MAPLTAAAELGRELRRLRRERGLSQRALVRALGLSAHSNLVQYELGRRIPPGDIIAACERLLDGAGTLRRLRAQALAERAAAGEPPRPDGPAMLPATVADFTGRDTELATLAELADGPPAAVVITAIAGTAGVGKTALAVRFAHQVAGRYPDGHLYLDLRGYSPAPPLTPNRALGMLLYALGVPAPQIPVDAERAAGLYRSLLAGKRVLVVLDNAYRADQVRPLLPGTPGCLVIVTSRNQLGGLIARDGARRLSLDALTPTEARALLVRMLGADRVAAEPGAAAEVAQLCGLLPLALRIAAANLAGWPHRTIAEYAAELRSGDRLGALAVDGDEQGAVRAAFAASYARLSPAARTLFRLLGLPPGPDLSAAAADALAGTDAAPALVELAAANLLTEPVPGRFACHDLVRRYALERASAGESAAAGERLYDWYLRGADDAARLLYPTMPLLSGPPESVVFDDDTRALAWLEAERANLLAAVQQGPHRTVWLLSDALRGFFWLRLYTADWLTVAHAGLAAARAEADPRAEAAAQLSLADADQCQGRYQQARARYAQVLEMTRRAGWRAGEVATLNSLGRVCWQLDLLAESVAHLSRALAIDRETGSVRGEAMRLANLGAMYHDLGRLREAVDHHVAALAIARDTGQRRGETICLVNLGMTYHGLGQPDEARDHLARALTMAREIGDSGSEAHALRMLAEVDLDDARALELAEAAMAVAENIDDRHYEVETLTTLAAVLARRGTADTALDRYEQALVKARETGSRYPEIVSLIGAAAIHGHGLGYAEAALRMARRFGYGVLEGQALTTLADLHLAAGRSGQAARYALRALVVHRRTGHRPGEARALVVLGHARRDTASWRQALELYTDMGSGEADAVRALLAEG